MIGRREMERGSDECAGEADALTGWRKVIRFRPGERRAAKRSYARRLRKWLKLAWMNE